MFFATFETLWGGKICSDGTGGLQSYESSNILFFFPDKQYTLDAVVVKELYFHWAFYMENWFPVDRQEGAVLFISSLPCIWLICALLLPCSMSTKEF